MLDALAAAAVPGGRVVAVVAGDDPLRRTVLRVRHAGDVDLVVKVAPAGSTGRGEREQWHLIRLQAAGIGGVPAPRGFGVTGEHEWSVETAVDGVPLADAGWWWRRRHGRAVLGRLADWCDALAAATVGPATDVLARAELASPVRERLEGVVGACAAPSVLQHGDLGSGANVLVDGRHLHVVDWETAVDDGVPLVDLLPAVALGLARLAGPRPGRPRPLPRRGSCRAVAARPGPPPPRRARRR